MNKKSVMIAMLAVFLFQTQAMAAQSDVDREILSGKSQRPVPIHDEETKDKSPSDNNSSFGISRKEPETVRSEEWQQEILAGKAQRSTSIREKEAKDETAEKDDAANKEAKKTTNADAEKKPATDKSEVKDLPEISEQEKAADPAEKPAKAVSKQEMTLKEKKPDVEAEDDNKKAPQKVSKNDWEREILSGKAQRSTPMD